MNSRISRCDHQRIEDFLKSDQVHIEDSELIAHLDSCLACQTLLEQQTADSESWKQAAQLLRETEFDLASTLEYSAASIESFRARTPVAIQTVLNSLTPSEDPSRLGRLDSYEITGVVGAGAMGVVLKAIDPALDRIVALKVMAPHIASHPTARKRFAREAKAAAAVLHPNVIPIYAVSSGGAMPYLVMAYIRGGSLQKRIDREGALNTSEILRIGTQIAAGLAAAHDQGLVHRDIKPENIMLGEGIERVTLTDFGLARSVDDASVTQQGTIAGTPQYMSPEQARGESVDQSSDLFSLGSVLYTLCTGRVPFHASSTHGVMRKIIDEEPRPIRELNTEIPQWLCDIIARLMAKNKTGRFKSAKEVHGLLESCLSHIQQPTVTKLPEGLRNLSRCKSRPLIPVTLAGCALALISMFALWSSGGLGFIAPEAKPRAEVVAHQEPSTPSAEAIPLTWKSVLGENAPEGYPTEPLRVFESLNKSRGKWSFAGKQRRSGDVSEFEAEMQVQGGFSNQSESPKSLNWQVTVLWPAKNPKNSLNFTLVPALNPDGVKWVMFATSSSSDPSDLAPTRKPELEGPGTATNLSRFLWANSPGDKLYFEGTWDPASQTFAWKPEAPRLFGVKAVPEELGREFKMTVSQEGGLLISDFQMSDSTLISGRSAAREGNFAEPNAGLLMLPNGYKIFFASGSEVRLLDKTNAGVAGARIDKIGCSGNIIYGLITQRDDAEKAEDALGYFWLDTTTGEIIKGMELGAWQDALKAKGVEELSLSPPERVRPRFQ